MPLFTVNGQNIFFAHVPKTGGSSIEDYLFRRFGPLSIRENARGKPANPHRKRDLIQSASHLLAADLQNLLPMDLAHSFAVVRDPLQRVISEYRFQSGVSKASGFEFSTWLRIMLKAAQLDPRVYENHIRPQSELVPEGARAFKFEHGFDPLVAWLDDVAGSNAPDIEMGHFLNRKKDPVAVSRDDVDMIRTFYAEDYRRFSYDDPDITTYPADRLNKLRTLPAAFLARRIVARQRRHWLR